MSTQNPKLRSIAEAAYLANPVELTKYSKKKNTLEENYKDTINNCNYFKSLKDKKYELFTFVDNKKDGFYAIALKNYKGEILISIRGTDLFSFNMLQIVFDNLFGRCELTANIITEITSGDLYNDLQIALGKIPNQYNPDISPKEWWKLE